MNNIENYMARPTASQKKRGPAVKKMDTNPPVAVAEITTPDTSKWPTRSQVADLLACSPTTLLNYERRGTLHPQYVYRADRRGTQQRLVVYNPDEFRMLAFRMKRGSARGSAREPGEIDARATEMFGEGLTNADVVVALRVTFEEVDVIRQKWTDGSEARLVISPTAKEALEADNGPFKDVAALVAASRARFTISPAIKGAFEALVGPFKDDAELLNLVTVKLAAHHHEVR